jgi:hypothetical protein
VKILFLGYRYTYFRNFDSVLRELARRGHEVHLAVEEEYEHGRAMIADLAAEYPTLTFGAAPNRADDEWSWVAGRIRHGLDYLRYQHRAFDDTPRLRERSRERTPGLFVALGTFVRRYARWTRRPLAAWLRWLERSVPEDASIRRFLEQQHPDVVLITPLITLGSSQIDYLRAARALRLPTALCVWSWDHLSSKALIRERPDRVFVWNDTQKTEAIEMHGVPADRVVVTGAQCFDKWFDRTPSRDRETFRREAGVPLEGPLILYVCSAPFSGSQPEAPFVVDWIRHLRAHGSPRVRSAPILVRPHPSRRPEWESVDVSSFANVVVWGAGDPADIGSRDDYFDSLYHSAAVVGLNTSAFIEAGIVGRPVHALLLPEWYESQMGTVHFRYLLGAGGGLLIAASSFDEHAAQLDRSLAGEAPDRRAFIQAFVRPAGLQVAATPRFADAVEAMRSLAVSPQAQPRLAGLAHRLLRFAIAYRDDVALERWVYSEREHEKIVRMRSLRESKAEKERALKRAVRATKEQRQVDKHVELERRRAAKDANKAPASR